MKYFLFERQWKLIWLEFDESIFNQLIFYRWLVIYMCPEYNIEDQKCDWEESFWNFVDPVSLWNHNLAQITGK